MGNDGKEDLHHCISAGRCRQQCSTENCKVISNSAEVQHGPNMANIHPSFFSPSASISLPHNVPLLLSLRGSQSGHNVTLLAL